MLLLLRKVNSIPSPEFSVTFDNFQGVSEACHTLHRRYSNLRRHAATPPASVAASAAASVAMVLPDELNLAAQPL